MDLLLSKVSLMQKVSQNSPQKYNLYSGLAVLTVTKINQKKLKARKIADDIASQVICFRLVKSLQQDCLQIIPRPTTKI